MKSLKEYIKGMLSEQEQQALLAEFKIVILY
jgi:hypothetical protein